MNRWRVKTNIKESTKRGNNYERLTISIIRKTSLSLEHSEKKESTINNGSMFTDKQTESARNSSKNLYYLQVH